MGSSTEGEKVIGNFSDKSLELCSSLLGHTDPWDFARCMRPNGTYYGSRGKCRKGQEVEARKRGTFLGGGLEGKVYDIGRGRVLKVSKSEGKRKAQEIAAELGIAPRVLATGKIKDDPKGRSFQIIEKVEAEEIGGIGRPGRKAKALDDLSEREIYREREALLAVVKLNSIGVAHGDIHGGNLQWDTKNDKPVIMDFDNAAVNKKKAKEETVELLTSIGIRLEESGRYDEADSFYELASSPSRNFFQRAEEVIQDNF